MKHFNRLFCKQTEHIRNCHQTDVEILTQTILSQSYFKVGALLSLLDKDKKKSVENQRCNRKNLTFSLTLTPAKRMKANLTTTQTDQYKSETRYVKSELVDAFDFTSW